MSVGLFFGHDVCRADSSCCQRFSQLLVPAHLLSVLLLEEQQSDNVSPSGVTKAVNYH